MIVSRPRTSSVHVLPVFSFLVLRNGPFRRSTLVVLDSLPLGTIETSEAHQLHHLLFLFEAKRSLKDVTSLSERKTPPPIDMVHDS